MNISQILQIIWLSIFLVALGKLGASVFDRITRSN